MNIIPILIHREFIYTGLWVAREAAWSNCLGQNFYSSGTLLGTTLPNWPWLQNVLLKHMWYDMLTSFKHFAKSRNGLGSVFFPFSILVQLFTFLLPLIIAHPKFANISLPLITAHPCAKIKGTQNLKGIRYRFL